MMKNKLSFFVGLLLTNLAFAQTFSPNFLDGSVMFKLKNNEKTIETQRVSLTEVIKYESLQDYPELAKVFQKYDVTSLTRPSYYTNKEDLQKIYRVKFNKFSEIDNLISDLQKMENVVFAEKEPIYKIDFVPNDPQHTGTTKWYHTLVGSENAWNTSQGSNSIKVAIVDNAVACGHTDLTTFKQRDVADNDNDATPPAVYTSDATWSHGTHCAGLATADINNGIGIASLGGNVELIGVKCTPNSGTSNSVYYSYDGVQWACSNGANVVSMSFGGTSSSSAFQNLINNYPDVVFLAAAGNDGNTTVNYPGGYTNVICVGSVDANDSRSGFSNYNGSTPFVDIASPGGYSYGGLQSTVYSASGNSYGKMGGTSMATPFAAGLAGLLLSINPTLTPAQVENCLITTGVTISGNIGPRIDAAAAVACAAATLTGDPLPQFSGSPTSIYVGQSVQFIDQSGDGGNTITAWQWSFPGGTPASYTGQNPPAITYSATGQYDVTLTVTNSQSQQSLTKTQYINVSLDPYGNWIPQATAFSQASRGITHIDIVDINTVWALAYDGSGGGANVQQFTKTTNGGTTWTPQNINVGNTGLGISMISAIDATTAWLAAYPNAGGQTGGIWKTTNGGTTWTRQTSATYTNASSFTNVVHFWNANDGFCQGDPISNEFELYTTTNGGTNWTAVPAANIPNPLSGEYGYTRDIEVIGDVVWFGTNKGRLYHSTNKGLNWSVYQTPETDMQNAKYSFKDANNGILITGGNVYKTTNAGANWTQITTTGSIFTSGLCWIEGTDIIFTTGGGGSVGSSYSQDGGVTWNIIDTDQHTYCEFINPVVGWSGWFNTNATTGGIWKWNSLQSALTPDFSATPMQVCVGQEVQFTDLTTGGTPVSYSWNFYGGVADDSTIANPKVTYATAGNYDVELTVNDGIQDVSKKMFGYITVVGAAPAVPSFIVGNMNPCNGDTTLYSTNSIAGVTYTWTLPVDWTGSSTSNSISVIVGTSGTISVSATNACGSSANLDSAAVVSCNVGIDNNTSAGIEFYPNPASEVLTLKVNTSQIGNNIKLIDMLGKVVFVDRITSTAHLINVESLPQGMYYIKVDGIESPFKFVKE
ncbi:MAG: S8 family serine peptidase [Flavobacteriales bacterium]|nr:S8 family serine peptidase [Flavobacteriales bacterium]